LLPLRISCILLQLVLVESLLWPISLVTYCGLPYHMALDSLTKGLCSHSRKTDVIHEIHGTD